jgi:hypothetical protein
VGLLKNTLASAKKEIYQKGLTKESAEQAFSKACKDPIIVYADRIDIDIISLSRCSPAILQVITIPMDRADQHAFLTPATAQNPAGMRTGLLYQMNYSLMPEQAELFSGNYNLSDKITFRNFFFNFIPMQIGHQR